MNPQAILALVTALGPVIQGLSGILPNLIPGLGAAFANPTTTTNATVMALQEALNALQAAGTVQFAGQPNSALGTPLIVDGVWGGRTFAAIKAVQAKFGFPVAEPLASVEMNILGTLLSKL